MTSKELIKANIINKAIRELDLFISTAEKVWEGKIVKKSSKYILKSIAYGVYDEAEYHMNTELKDKVLNVLREHLKELNDQLNNL
ncbi:hypothetical protein [Clostridium tagluense]|uniref:hypothetical protein n=1 Tax=Clostridium tagluense TaxID=360422 RepID=UPI001C0CB7DE|nr:hypothetical protein [Clostridium tagluense]MBU3126752.1 hypothetical protein [Clostridium tagluense]